MRKLHFLTLLFLSFVLVSCATTTTSGSEQKDIIVKVVVNEKNIRSGAVWDWELKNFKEKDYSDADPTLPVVVELIDVKSSGYNKTFTFKFNREGHAFFNIYYHPYGTRRDPYADKQYFLHYVLDSDFKYYKYGTADEVKRDPKILKMNVYEYGSPEEIRIKAEIDRERDKWEKEHPEELKKYQENMKQIYNIERDVAEYMQNHPYNI